MGISFTSGQLLPMGSHPRVKDRKGTYDLFGPVNKLFGSSQYDKAMFCECCQSSSTVVAARVECNHMLKCMGRGSLWVHWQFSYSQAAYIA